MTLKDVVDVLTATAAVIAAISSLVSAVKSSKAKTEAGQAKAIAQEIRTDVRTNVMTSLATVVRQTNTLQQNQNIHITVAGTSAQGLAANAPILEPQPAVPQQHLPDDPARREQ